MTELLLYFSDDLLDEDTILDWLKRNRYKRVELDWIMYSVMSVALAFLLYSAFLVFGLPPKEAPKKGEDDWERKKENFAHFFLFFRSKIKTIFALWNMRKYCSSYIQRGKNLSADCFYKSLHSKKIGGL